MNAQDNKPELRSRVPAAGWPGDGCRRASGCGLTWLLLVGLLGALPVDLGQSQINVPLLNYTDYWAYQSWGTNLGTSWRSNDFDDGEWFSGQGLLAAEVTPYPVPFNTPLWLAPPDSTVPVITYYFRTRFDWPFAEVQPGVVLLASNLVDDGCVIYLNGVEAGRLRMPQTYEYSTLATSGPPVEGVPDVLSLNASALRPGSNLLAVEVHQSSAPSPDVVWGMALTAQLAQPLTITHQPIGQTNSFGETVTLSVGVSGWPVYYQWKANGFNIVGQTSAAITLNSGSSTQVVNYTVVVTNAISSETSEVAQVQFLPDRTGPMLVSAIVRDSGPTNNITVTLSERISTMGMNVSNFSLIHLPTASPVVVSNVTLVNNLISLRVGGANWLYPDPYVLRVSNVRDIQGNVMAPQSEIPVQWPLRTNVLGPDQVWSYHDSAAGDPGVYDENWADLNYMPDAWWKTGTGVFWDGSQTLTPCVGDWGSTVPYQAKPTLFRTRFEAPPGASRSNYFRLTHLLDDGAVFFLNGVEFHRFGVAPGVRVSLGATAAPVDQPACVTTGLILVTNLLPGTNCLAVGLVQSPPGGDADQVFGLQLEIGHVAGPVIDLPPPPTLMATRPDPERIVFSWEGYGFALESSRDLSSPISYPRGPWVEETNMSNPFTNVLADPFRSFRLKRK